MSRLEYIDRYNKLGTSGGSYLRLMYAANITLPFFCMVRKWDIEMSSTPPFCGRGVGKLAI